MRFLRLLAIVGAALILANCNEETDTGLLTSPDGHAFAFLPLPEAKTVSVQVIWPMNWALDPGHNPAVSHIATKALLLGGSTKMTAPQLQEAMSKLGAEAFLLNAGVSLRAVVNVPPAHLDQALQLTNELLQSPAMPVDVLDQLRLAMSQAQTEAYLRPTEQAFLALRLLVMKDQPNYAESLSFSDTDLIKSVTEQDVRDWHRQTLVANGALIAVAGPLDAAGAGRAVDLLFAGLPSDTDAPPVAEIKPMDLRPRSILLHAPSAAATTLAVIARMPATGDSGEMDDMMAVSLLGGDDTAALASALTLKFGAPANFSASIDAFSRKNRILVMAGEVQPQQLVAVRDVVVKSYADFANQMPSQAQLDRWTKPLATSLAAGKNDPVNRASAMLESMIDGNSPMDILLLDAMLAKVSPESVQQRFASAFAPASELIFVVISPDATILPDACVISQPKDVLACP